MANRTVKDAHSIKGTNPQYLVEKIIRSRIYESRYWKESCFALTAELLVDKAMEIRYIGGSVGGNIKPTPFLCLVLKMLQIQPEKDIVVEFIRNADFKYVRALGAMYMRLVGTSIECYKYLEPLYNDFRKLRRQNKDGNFAVVHMDEFVDDLLREERVNDIILPRIQKRNVLEDNNELEARVSALEEDMDDVESSDEEVEVETRRSPSPSHKRSSGRHRDWDKPTRSPSPKFRKSASPQHRRRSRSRERHRERDAKRHRSRSPRERRQRSRSRERERHRRDDDRKHHRSSKRSHREDRDEKKSKRDHDHGDRHRHRDKERGGESSFDREVREANEMRAKLGLAPLRP